MMIAAVKSMLFSRRSAGAAPAVAGSRRSFGSRFAVVLSGELIQSLFHFVLNVLLVRTLAQADYGLFAMVFVCGAVGITYIRAIVSVPATLFLARSTGRPAERGYDVVFGTAALATALVMGGLAALLLFPAIGVGALSAGAFIALYMFRSHLRIVLLARKAPRLAGLSDAVYCGVGIVSIVVCLHTPAGISLKDAFLALALGHACGIVVAYAALRQPLRLTLRRSLWRRYHAIWRTVFWSLTGVTSNTIQGQGLTFAFAALAGPSDYAPIAATLVLFAPLRIPTNALTNMVLAEMTGLFAKGQTERANRLVVRSTVVIAIGCLIYGAAMLIALPTIEHILFNKRFDHEPMNWIAGGVWAAMLVSLLYAIPRAYLEARGAFRTIAQGAAIAAIIGFAIMVPVLLTMPSPFALLGLIASEAFVFLWLGRAFRRMACPNRQPASARRDRAPAVPGPQKGSVP